MKLQDQIALVTGGSRGIGRATALLFAQEGADIAFCHLDDSDKAEETAAEIRVLGRRAMHKSVDVADIAATKAFAGEVASVFGPIDILFNNAGMNIRKPFEAYIEDEFDRIMAVHMKGMFFMAQAVYPAMAARGRGCIINVASQRGLKGRGQLGALFGGQGRHHGVYPRLVVGGRAEGGAGQRHRARTDRHRPDGDNGPGGPAGVHRRAAGQGVLAARRKSPRPRCCWLDPRAGSSSAPPCRPTAET